MDTINVEILEDGTLSITTDKISEQNHMSADELIRDLEKVMGGKVEKNNRPDKKQHVHKIQKA